MNTTPTPTEHALPFRAGDFSTLAEALDYAARGRTGANFYSGRGVLYAAMPYERLRDEARTLAFRLHGLGLERGSRVALVGATNPDFLRFFFACQYAGLIPVTLPASIHLGGRQAYIGQLHGLLADCGAAVAMAPPDFMEFLVEAGKGLELKFLGLPQDFDELPRAACSPRALEPGESAYVQYTSGSTRFPRGVVVTQRAVLHNLRGILKCGVEMAPGDRCMSWLPYYHDMGLVGLVLCPLASQISVDYLDTRDFALRPRRWLALMSETRATVSFSPPFGYELCARRVQSHDVAQYDLSHWRVAGVGAETIRAETLERFAKALAPSGFDSRAFLPCYGMAECSLAISFAPLGKGVEVDHIHVDAMPEGGPQAPEVRTNEFVKCGIPLPGYEVMIRDAHGDPLPERHIGTIAVRGRSVMSGYFGQPEITREILSASGWLDTGDLGYLADGHVVVTGRKKDLIIIHGRNIWPQDLEHLAEQQPEVRTMDASAFSVPGSDGTDKAVLVVQCRVTDPERRAALVQRLQRLVHQEFGIDCLVDLVPPHTLPRTSSGKLSRSSARKDYLRRVAAASHSSARAPAWEGAAAGGA